MTRTTMAEGAPSPRGRSGDSGWTRLPAWLPTHELMIGLSHRQFRVFVHLLAHSWRGGPTDRMLPGQVYRSPSQIAEDLHLDRSSVYRDIRGMVEMGLLERADGKLVVDRERWTSTEPRGVGETPTGCGRSAHGGVGVTPTGCGQGTHRGVGVTPTGCGRNTHGGVDVTPTIEEPSDARKPPESPFLTPPRPFADRRSDVKTSEEESERETTTTSSDDDDVSRAAGDACGTAVDTADGPSSSESGSEDSYSGSEDSRDGNGNGDDDGNGGSPRTTLCGDRTDVDRSPGSSPPGAADAAAPGESGAVGTFLEEHGLTPSQAREHGGSLTLAEARALFAHIEERCARGKGSNPVAIVVSILTRGRSEIEAVLRQPGARATARRVPPGTGRAVGDEDMRASIESNRRLLSDER